MTGDPGTGTQTFSYDPLDRLIESELGSDLRSYSYDLDGNRRSRDEGGVLTTYTYDRTDAVVEQTIGTTVTAFAYDGFGNLTGAGTAASGTTAYAYDLGDRLTGLTPPGGSATTFSYDAVGRIATRSVPGAGTDAYSYVGLTEDAWQVSNGSAATGSLVAPDGSRLSVLDGSTLGWTIPDLHGSLVATTDTADALSSALRYDGYGQTQSSWTVSGPLPSPWRYQGRLELSPDAANPLYENGARSYSPGLGAFTQLDSYTGSAQDPLSMNRYLYAEANPATLIDPTGHYVQRGPDSDRADSQLAPGTGGGQQAAQYQAPAYQAPPQPPRSGPQQYADPGGANVNPWPTYTADQYASLTGGLRSRTVRRRAGINCVPAVDVVALHQRRIPGWLPLVPALSRQSSKARRSTITVSGENPSWPRGGLGARSGGTRN